MSFTTICILSGISTPADLLSGDRWGSSDVVIPNNVTCTTSETVDNAAVSFSDVQQLLIPIITLWVLAFVFRAVRRSFSNT